MANLKVKDLSANTNVSIRLRVISCSWRHVTARGQDLVLHEYTCGDETGTIKYTRFSREDERYCHDDVKEGTILEFHNARVTYYKHHLQLSKGSYGEVKDPSFPDLQTCATAGTPHYSFYSEADRTSGRFSFESDVERLSIFKEELFRLISAQKTLRKVKRALEMIKTQTNTMFVMNRGTNLIGVVQSQQNPEELKYGTMLNSKGKYSCYTQDGEQCMGLQGTICKHVLLTLIGAVKDNAIPMIDILMWLETALSNKPSRSKKLPKEIFSLWEASKVEPVEWRTVELFPEDLIAF